MFLFCRDFRFSKDCSLPLQQFQQVASEIRGVLIILDPLKQMGADLNGEKDTLALIQDMDLDFILSVFSLKICAFHNFSFYAIFLQNGN